MATLDQFRSILPNGKDLSDAEIVGEASKLLGMAPQDLAEKLGMATGKTKGALASGFSSGIDELQGLGYSAGAALADITGADKARDWLNRNAERNQYEAQINSRPDLERIEDVTLKSAIPYLGYQAAKQIPNVAGAIGLGALVPEAAVPALLSRGGALLPRALGGGGYGAAEGYAAKKAAVAAGNTFGEQVVGGAAFNEGQAIGSLYQSAKENPEDKSPGMTALLGSVPYAISETLPGAMLAGRLVHGSGFTGNLLTRMAKSAGVQSASGATSELLQNEMEMGVGKPLTEEQKFSQRLNSGVAGGLVEGLFGAGGGFRNTARPTSTGNELQQSFAQPDVSGTPTTNVAPPVAPTAPTAGIPAATTPPAQTTQAAPTNVAPEQTGQQAAPTEQIVSNAAPTPPAVTGGETAIAQQTQAAAAENAQVEAAQQQQVKRNEALGQFATAYNPEDPTSLKILGQDIVGAPRVTAFGNAFANELTKIPAHGVEIAKAIVQANDATGGKLVSFSFNANNVVGSATKAAQAIGKAATKYQIDHVQSVDEAAQILNKLSMTAKSSQLEHINAIHEALTGKDTEGFIASQTAEGAKNGKQQQNTARVGEVPVQGGAGEASSTGNGTVRSSIVQPVGTGSVPEGSLGLQVGQPSGEGIRNGTSSNAGVGSSLAPPVIGESNGQTNGQTNAAAQIITGLGEGGQIPSQLQQDGAVSTVSSTEKPVRKASEPEVSTTSAILSSLYRAVLTPTQQRKGGASLEQRIDIVRMAVNEQISEEDIAEKTGLPITTVDAQLRRLGIVLRPQLSQATLDERAAIAERLGISPEILQAAFDVDAKNRAKFLSDSITVDVTPEDRARSVSRLVSTMAGQNLQYVIVTPNPETQKDGSIKQYERLDVLFQRAADAYRSPEFPKGIPRRDLLELTEYKNVDVRRSTASELLDEIARGPEQDFDKTKLLAEELYSSENQDTQSMGTIATAGGSQGEVESQRKAALADIERLQNKLDATPEEDVAGRENLEKLLRLAFAKYTGGTATEKQATVAALEKEKPTAAKATVSEATAAAKAKWKTAKNDLSKLDAGELQLLLDEANKFKNRELAKKIDAELASRTTTTGEKNAVQVKSTNEGNVREPAGGGQEVGKANAEPQKPAREGKAEPKQEAKPEEVIKTPAEEWVTMRAIVPQLPAYNTLDQNEQIRWDDLVHRGTSNLAAAVKIISERLEPTSPVLANNQVQAEGANGTTETVEARVIEETVEPQVAALPAPQVTRLENHYGVKQNSPDFLAKVKEDVIKYATKGAEAVSAAIRDIIKAIHSGVLAVAMIFNPTAISQIESFVVIPQKTRTTQEQVLAQVPAEASMMSDAGKQAYERLIPALKNKIGDKFITIADKPSGRIFVFKSDGTFVLQKKSLFGFAKGDLYKGNNDLPQNRITPAGLFGIHVVDAAQGGAAAKTAGEYDFGKVFALDDPDATVTFMHSVWLHEKDANQRAAALKNESAADSRYSFGCINVDKETYRTLITKYGSNMDGSKLFVVPDQQSTVQDFLSGNVANDKLVREGIQPVTRTVTAPVKSTTNVAAAGQNLVGKEEETPSFNSRSTKFMEFDELATDVGGVDSVRSDFADLDIEHALDFVSDWNTIDDAAPNAFHGQLRVEQGRYIGTLNTAKMVSPAYAAETVRHEVAHAVDMAPHGGVYSHQQEMNLSIVDGKVVPVGEVAKEMFNLYNTDESFRKFLAYPFDISVHTDLDTNGKIESELFAQIFSVYTNPTHMDAFAALAPKTAAYLKEVVNDIRSITTFQVQKSTTAATRALDFRNRYTARRDQGTAPVFGNIGQRIEAFNSRSRGYTPDQVIGKLPPMLQRPTRNIVTNLLHQAKRGLYASAITEDVVSMASKYMKSAQKYLTAQYARQATRLNFEKQIESILSAYDKLPTQLQGDDKGSVNEYIYDATYQKKWGYYPGEHRVGTTLFEVDPDFETRFKAFPPAAQQLIRNVFEHGYQALKLKQRAAQTAVEREFASRVAAAGNDADAIKQIEKEKRLMLARQTKLTGVEISNPYAYLGRYGDYIVVAKSKEFIAYEDAAKGNEARVSDRGVVGDPQQAKNWLQDNVSNPLHYIVQFAETQAEADEIAAKLQATGNYDVQPEDAGIREAHESYAGNSDMHMAVARLRKLAERNTNTNDAALNKMISDLYLMTVAEASARRSELQRKYVTGADKNMMRNLATSGRADAHFLSTMEHSDEINDSLEAMRDEALRNRRDAMPLYNELYNRYAGSTNYEAPGPLVTGLTRMSTLWYLSTNPAFYLQQVLQTGVLSLPYMAGRLGYFRSARAIKRAYGDMSELVKDLGVTEHVDFDKAPDDVRFMLKALVGMGKIDIGIDADAKARTEEKGVMGTVMHKLQGVNTRIETINRAVAAIAAYRGYIDRYKGATGADGIRYAAEVVSNTHGSYDGFNTPRVLQGGTAKVLLQFKRFQIIQLSMLAKLIHTAFNDASPAEKAVARASLKYLTAHMAVLGGALAVPFVSQMAWILSKILGDEDEPDDYEYKMRRWIGDEAVADLLLKGVPAALGVDLSGKLGMQNVASILPFADGDLTSRAGAEKILVGIMGPTANLGLKLADSLGMMTKGEYYKGLELALPNGIGNAMKGYRFATEGITMRNGDLVMKPEEVSLLDAAFQAVGLPTAPITDRQYTQRVVMEFDKFYAARSSDIKSSYVQASRNSDSEGMGEARTDWEKLQVSRAANGYKRQPMSDLYKAPAAAAKRERGVVGGVETTKSNRRFVEQVNSVS